MRVELAQNIRGVALESCALVDGVVGQGAELCDQCVAFGFEVFVREVGVDVRGPFPVEEDDEDRADEQAGGEDGEGADPVGRCVHGFLPLTRSRTRATYGSASADSACVTIGARWSRRI